MKKASIFFILFLVILKSWGQVYDEIDKIVKSYPSQFEDTQQLANQINNDFETDKEKVRALYNWISLHITYDYRNDDFDISKNRIMYFDHRDRKRQLQKRKLERIERTLKYKKAVCIDYSELFKEVCDKIGIQAEIVLGYSKVYINDIENEKEYKNHSWNVVKINNSWRLIDVTWASTLANGLQKKLTEKFHDYYFFTKPKEFIATHFPVNPQWQLLKNKFTKEEFLETPLLYPKYFWDGIKISKFQKGVIEANKKRLQIYFDKIPTDKKLFYIFEGDTFIKPIVFKKTKEGQFISSIKYIKSSNSQITIYSDLMPVAGFKISPSIE